MTRSQGRNRDNDVAKLKWEELALVDDPYQPFDPLAVENVGVTLAVELLEQSLYEFPPFNRFPGAGVYALYYKGKLPAYRDLVKLDNGRMIYPIYIGRALRDKVTQGFNPRPTTRSKLFLRINKHAESIEQTSNLKLSDFGCRYLVIEDAYIHLAESVMIMIFRPPWNGMGLGSNPVGGPRMRGTPSLWDSLHPGRAGRPAGGKKRAKEAEEYIKRCVRRLGESAEDPRSQRMFEKVMRFV